MVNFFKFIKFLFILIHFYFISSNSFADPLKDLKLNNEITSLYKAGNLKKVEDLLNGFSNEQLKMTWVSNLLLKYSQKSDLNSVVRLHKKLKDQNLQQIWTSNILLQALKLKKCKIGKSFIGKLKDENLRKTWKLNYSRC